MTIDGKEYTFHLAGNRLLDDGSIVQPTLIVVTCDDEFVEALELVQLCEKLNRPHEC